MNLHWRVLQTRQSTTSGTGTAWTSLCISATTWSPSRQQDGFMQHTNMESRQVRHMRTSGQYQCSCNGCHELGNNWPSTWEPAAHEAWNADGTNSMTPTGTACMHQSSTSRCFSRSKAGHTGMLHPTLPAEQCLPYLSPVDLRACLCSWLAQVLGTFITEFGQGRLRCDRMFSSCETARQVADQLVAIAAHYGFEGWLVSVVYTLRSQLTCLQPRLTGI